MMRRLLYAALVIVGLLVGGLTALSAVIIDDDTGGGTATYLEVPFAISWTSHYEGYYITDSSNNIYVTDQNIGGCIKFFWRYPFPQVVTSTVYYFYPGFSPGPFNSIDGPALCDVASDDRVWGSGTLAINPRVIFLVNIDPPGSDYSTSTDTWQCASCLPSIMSRSKTVIWH